MTWARVSTAAPASISSATLRPSRAPSRMKSVISATASGWLSLMPRSSLRRATIAAMATRSLSLSRGVRCIALLSMDPEARQAASPERHQQARQILTQACAARGNEPRKRKAVPGGDADLARKRLLADRAHQFFLCGENQNGCDCDRAARAGACRELFRDGPVETNRIGEQ